MNYDIPLIGIARLIVAPPAPWSSDRSVLIRPRRLRFTQRLLGPQPTPIALDGEPREEIAD